MARLSDAVRHLPDHLHQVPVHVISCVEGRTDHALVVVQASRWGSILPAAWSFMLAARARTLGTDFRPAARSPLDTMAHWDRWQDLDSGDR